MSRPVTPVKASFTSRTASLQPRSRGETLHSPSPRPRNGTPSLPLHDRASDLKMANSNYQPVSVTIPGRNRADEDDDAPPVTGHVEGAQDSGEHLLLKRAASFGSVPTGTVLGSVITLTNTILGAGMLALPAAIAAVGLIPGILLILFSGTCSAFGLWLLVESARRTGPRGASFFALSRITYPSAAGILDTAVAVKCFGVGVSYLVIVGDLLPQVADAISGHTLPEDSIFRSKPFFILASTPLVIPTVMLRKLDSLRHTSTAALGAVLYLLILVVVMFFQLNAGRPSKEIDLVLTPKMGVLRAIKALPVFIFAFTCHQNIFSTYNELQDNAAVFVNRVIQAAILISISTYLVLGIIGYLTFGRNVASNVIGAYPTDQVFVVIGQVCIAVLVLFSFPLQAHPARTSIDKVLMVLFPSETPPPRMSRTRHISISVVLLVASYATAILSAGQLGSVLSIVGATGSVTIQYILPGLFYWKATEGEFAEEDNDAASDTLEDGDGPGPSPSALVFTPASRTMRKLALALAIYGFAVMFVALGARMV